MDRNVSAELEKLFSIGIERKSLQRQRPNLMVWKSSSTSGNSSVFPNEPAICLTEKLSGKSEGWYQLIDLNIH